MPFIQFSSKGQDVEIKDGKVTVNGKEMTPEEASEAVGTNIQIGTPADDD